MLQSCSHRAGLIDGQEVHKVNAPKPGKICWVFRSCTGLVSRDKIPQRIFSTAPVFHLIDSYAVTNRSFSSFSKLELQGTNPWGYSNKMTPNVIFQGV